MTNCTCTTELHAQCNSLQPPLREDRLNRCSKVAFQSFATWQLQGARVQTQLMQDRCMDVRHIMPILNRMETDLVSRTVSHAAFDAATANQTVKP